MKSSLQVSPEFRRELMIMKQKLGYSSAEEMIKAFIKIAKKVTPASELKPVPTKKK